MAKISMVMVLVAMMIVIMVPQAGATPGSSRANPIVVGDDLDGSELTHAIYRTRLDIPQPTRRYVLHDQQGSITVQVMDAATGKPVPGARVYLAARAGNFSPQPWARLPATGVDGITGVNNVGLLTHIETTRNHAREGSLIPLVIQLGDTQEMAPRDTQDWRLRLDWQVDLYPGLRDLLPEREIDRPSLEAMVGSARIDKIARILFDAYVTDPDITPTGRFNFNHGLSRGQGLVGFSLMVKSVDYDSNLGRMGGVIPIESVAFEVHVHHPDYNGGRVGRVKPILTNMHPKLVATLEPLPPRGPGATVRLQPAPPTVKPEPVVVPPVAALPVVQTPMPGPRPVPSPRPEPVPVQEIRETPGAGIPGGGLDTAQVQEPQPVATPEPVPHTEPATQPEPVPVQEQAKAQASPIWPVAAAGAAGLGAGLIPLVMLHRRRGGKK